MSIATASPSHSGFTVRQSRLIQVLPGLVILSGTIWFRTPSTHRTARK
jgi:hypothetical protein